MHAIPAILFLAAALLCSLVGRILLINAAYSVSTRWLFTVLFVPFGPLFFRLQHAELARPTRYWRLATLPLMLLFVLNGGDFHSLTSFGKASNVQASAGDTHFHLPVPTKVVTAALGKGGNSTDPDSSGSTRHISISVPVIMPPAKATPAKATPTPPAQFASAKPATPSPAVAAAAAKMADAPKILSPAERLEANRQEFARLAAWYDNLKHERGYLRKGDTDAIEAYNAEAAQYQTALQLAKNEQAALTKLTAKK